MSHSELHAAVIALERAVAARLLAGAAPGTIALEGASRTVADGLPELADAPPLPIAVQPLPDPAELVTMLLRGEE